MPADCCRVVGEFPITDRCIISVSMNSSTETSKTNGDLIIGPTIGTVSVTAYADTNIHIGCPGRASVSIPWVRKYDCDNNDVYFLFSGAGQASVAGDVGGLASIVESIGKNYNTVSASSSSGPAAVYFYDSQEDGYGLDYNGAPYIFNSTNENDVLFSRIVPEVGPNEWHLQSFNLECGPGQLPTASYSFVFQIKD